MKKERKSLEQNKHHKVKESLIPVTEGGIYALNIDLEAAADAFEDKLRDIFQVDSISMEYDRSGIDLELIPARGWTGGDPYFRATIHGLEEVIYKLMNDKYKKLVDEDEVKINPYSDFAITGWKSTDYQDGVTLDAYTHTFDNEEEYAALDAESDRIGKEIAKIIFSHYDELVSLLSEFVEYDEYEDDELNDYEESLVPITEGGIYPVDLDDAAVEAFEDKLSQILNGYVGVKNLKLMPAYGFGGAGVYWYKCDIDLGDDVIENLLDSKSTPEAYKANENNDLIIYMPSVTVNCSHDNEYEVYVDLDSRNESDNYDELKNEENIISDKIIAMLTANENDLVELLREYEIFEDDYEESLIPITKNK